jgi:hypothetical protein
MRLPLKRLRRRGPVPQEIARAVPLGRNETVLTGAADVEGAAWLVATNHSLALVTPDGVLVWTRPWHEVDHGSWNRESGLLTVTWVDRSRPAQWRFGDERGFLQTLRERVQASVVLTEELSLSGRRTGRAVIRQDLASRDLVEQVILGRGVREDDEVREASARALGWLREQVGMPS